MGSIVKGVPSPAFSVKLDHGTPLLFAVTGPSPEVVGHAFTVADIPTQDVIDRAAAHFQAFYDGLPLDERQVITIMLQQAEDMQRQLWPE